MSDVQAEPRASTTADTKAIIRAVVATGIGIATLLLMLAGLLIQQNANFNARFDDVHRRIDDVNANLNARIDDLQDEIRELRAEVRADIRELREIVINVLKGEMPAD